MILKTSEFRLLFTKLEFFAQEHCLNSKSVCNNQNLRDYVLDEVIPSGVRDFESLTKGSNDRPTNT